ncbi:MAG: VWA domain-containing protein [Clostridiales bacterium]|nr:VWA domain-containing protein [Clostridiales bacterium]
MDLANYMRKEGRALPVFLLVDISGSMRGEKIETVNVALKEMINSFKKIENPIGVIELCIITFGDQKAQVVKPLSKILDTDQFEFSAGGSTPMGKAFDVVSDMIEDYEIVSRRAYTPTIVLISDGNPTDFDGYSSTMKDDDIYEWEALKRLQYGIRSSKATRLAMGIGADMDSRILRAFINNESIPAIKARDNDTISKFFKWVTMSISVRSISVNPDVPVIGDTEDLFDKGEIEF